MEQKSSRATDRKITNVAFLYARVSTAMQVNDGFSLDAQGRTLQSAAELAGFTEYELMREEGRSGKSIKGRPVLRDALRRLAAGEADALFVTRIDRLARSTQDFLSIVDHANQYGWRLVLLDLNLDTSTHNGRFTVTIMSALAEMERGIIAERQRDVHKDRRDRGLVWGVDLGPRARTALDVVQRINSERLAGKSLRAIAAGLNADGITSPYGGQWGASSIKHVLAQGEQRKPDTQG